MLDTASVSAYRDDGHLFPVHAFGAEEAAFWRRRFEAFESDAAATQLPRPVADYLRGNLHLVSTAAADLARHPALTDIAASVLGPDVLVWMVEYIAKEPNSSAMLSVHQDLNYWGFDGADHLVTVWVALSEVTDAHGAMHFVTGSHRLGSVAHHDTYGDDNLLSRGQEIEVDFDAADEVAVELHPGQVSLHHGLMFHGSGPNTTDERRIGVVIRYISPDAAKAAQARDYAMPVRGADRHGNLVTVAGAARDLQAADLELWEEATAAQEQALAAGADDKFSYTRALTD